MKYRHTWNVIRIGGQYYHLDAIFDNTLSEDGTVWEKLIEAGEYRSKEGL